MKTLLVANRGEIARRVLRTAAQLGLRTVAVYADPDRDAPHVREADGAIALGGASAAQTYLNGTKLLDAARRTGADTIHPGYGFLSENAGFAAASAAAGLTFVGPRPETISAMGDKEAAKRAMAATGVPVLASYDAGAVDPPLPVLVKAAAGGGGKGMRRVDAIGDLAGALAAASREAESAFGDGRVFLERHLAAPRHVEVQVFGDAHGNVVHLGERECSVQRRHQKVIEESPSPGVTPELRERMLRAAVAGAGAIGYLGAGTFEFLVDGDEFFFLETNTRLQVEHPVTEAVTGLDLVRWQLYVADGQRLFEQSSVTFDGHAIEARVCAEDAMAGYLPSVGTVSRWRTDPRVELRYDSGVEDGTAVPSWYDPMLAKVIAHAPTRGEAAARLALGLRRLEVHGVTTNRDLLVGVLEHADFCAGATTTVFLEHHPGVVSAGPPPDVVDLHAAAVVLSGAAERRATANVLAFTPSGWRNLVAAPQRATVSRRGGEVSVEYRLDRDGGAAMTIDGRRLDLAALAATAGSVDVEAAGVRHSMTVARDEAGRAWVNGGGWQTDWLEQPRFALHDARAVAGGAVAPVPGTILGVLVAPGDHVEAGDTLVTVEAMKMEHRITAAASGVVRSVLVEAGRRVDANEVLVVVDAEHGEAGGAAEGGEAAGGAAAR